MAEAQQFDVVVRGRVAAGRDPAAVRRSLAALMKISEEAAERYLQGNAARVLSGVDPERARLSLRALEEAGVEAVVVAHGEEPAAAPASPRAVAQPTRRPPQERDEVVVAATSANRRPQPSSSAARSRPPRRGLPAPVLVGAAVVVVVAAALALVSLTGRRDPPRYLLLEPANAMARDLVRVHDVMCNSNTYLKVSSSREAPSEPGGGAIGKPLLMAAIEDSFRQSAGQATLNDEVQTDLDSSGIVDVVSESKARIRERLDELAEEAKGCSAEYESALQSLQFLHSLYEQVIDIGIHPGTQPTVIEFVTRYDTGRMMVSTAYLSAVEAALLLEAGDPADEEVFVAAREEAMRLGDRLKEQL